MNLNNLSKKKLIEKINQLESELGKYKTKKKLIIEEPDTVSEEKFRSLFNNINVAVALHKIVTDKKGTPVDFIFLDANPAYEKTTHLKIKDIIGKKGSEVIPTLEQRWIDIYGKVAQTGKPVTITDHSEYLDKYWEVKAFSPAKNQFAVALTDITERKHAEDTLKKNEEVFRSIIESSPIAIYVYELNSSNKLIFSDYNKAADKLLGLDHSIFVGKTLEEAFPPLAKTDVPFYYKEAAIHGKSWYTEQVNYDYKGIKGIFEIYAFQIYQGKVAIMFNNISERKNAEEKLRFERDKAQTYLDIAGVIIIAINLVGEITLINQKGCEVLGYEHNEIIHKNWFDNFIPADIRGIVKKVFNKIIKGKLKPVEYFENPVLNKNGEIRIIAWHNKMLKDDEGNIIGTLSSGEDITERKITENALKESEARYRTILYSIGDGIIATDIKGKVMHMNSIAEELTGWKEQQAVNKPVNIVFNIINEYSRKKVENPLEKILKKGAIVGLANQTILISKTGKEIPIADSGAPIKNEKGEITGIVLIFRDQTVERLNKYIAEIRLSLIEYSRNSSLDELITKALDEVGALVDSPIGFYHFVEPDQKTLSLQQWSTRTLEEFCKAEAKGLHYNIGLAGVWVDCVHEKKPVVHNNYNALKHKKGLPKGHAEVIRELVVPVMRKNKIVAILGVGNKPQNYTEKDVEIVSYLADITWEIVKQKRAAEELVKKNIELTKAKEKAEESDRLKSAFLTNMSHEIRTPMNGIIGFSGMFKNPDLSTTKREHYANIVIESGKQLLTIINDILDISMIETNTVKLVYEEVVINDIMDELYSFFKPQFDSKGLTFTVSNELNKTDSIIKTDKARLRQVLTNLISNAYKFTNKGSVIFGYKLINTNLQFYVEDTGIGIPKNQQNKIFDRFRQVNMEATRPYGGTGLGLSISKKLVELLGGKVWVESETGITSANKQSGSTFFFTVPYNLTQSKRRKTEHMEALDSNKSYTILIAEDEDINFMFIKEALASQNINFIRTVNGKETVEACKKDPTIDLVLMDIKMPVLNGYEATKQIKKIRPDLPVIAQTAYAMDSDKVLAKKAGCDDYLPKPIDVNQLIHLVNKYIKSKGQELIF